MDGLIFSCLGCRIERDPLAVESRTSNCKVFGLPPWMSCSTFVGLYWADFKWLPKLVAAVATHKGAGLFVVPIWPGHGPLLALKGPDRPACHWYELLRAHTLLEFDLVDQNRFKHMGGPLFSLRRPFRLVGLFVVFGWRGMMKSKKKKEKTFKISYIKMPLGVDQSHLDVKPFVPTRISPLADGLAPSPDADVCKGTLVDKKLFMSTPPVLEKPACRWSPSVFRKWADEYPFPREADLACEVAGEGLQIPFMGDPSKMILRENSPRLEGKEDVVRKALMKEVIVGRIAGPFPAIPFPADGPL